MKHRIRHAALISLLLLNTVGLAPAAEDKEEDKKKDVAENLDTVYVTDLVHLKLYAKAGGKGGTLKTLSSGDALKLLDTKGRYHKVETVDGVVGWVKKFYTVSKPPAAVVLPEIQKLLEERDAEVEKLKQQLQQKAIGAGLKEDYEQKLIQLNEENVALTNEKEQLRKRLDQLELERLHNESGSTTEEETVEDKHLHPAAIAAITAFGGLLLGTILGYRLYASRLKKRFYGHKI